MGKYDDLDAEIIKTLDEGYNTFDRLSGRMASTDWRLLDRRLQMLRKNGWIEFAGRAWKVKK